MELSQFIEVGQVNATMLEKVPLTPTPRRKLTDHSNNYQLFKIPVDFERQLLISTLLTVSAILQFYIKTPLRILIGLFQYSRVSLKPDFCPPQRKSSI